MDTLNLKKVGNIKKDYNHEPRSVAYSGLVTERNLVMKLYAMFTEPPVLWDLVVDAKKFLVSEISGGKIEPLTGMGFAILSKDMLNVARWDTEYPIVLRNQIYGYHYNNLTDDKLRAFGLESRFHNAELFNTQEIGSFCIWELGIVNFEKDAWKEYLASKRTKRDKKQYLGKVIEGPL